MTLDKNLSWKLLSQPYSPDQKEALLQQYHASQFLAIMGRFLLPRQADDSNTNFTYLPEEQIFIGRELDSGVKPALQLNGLKLKLLDGAKLQLAEIKLVGKTRNEVFNELKQTLENLNIGTSNLKNELHYDLIDHGLLNGKKFQLADLTSVKELIAQRNNAEIVLQKVSGGYEDAESVRIWPHHFDTGSLLPLSYNQKGQLSSSIGIGWAVQDSMMNEPYFYVSFWSEENILLGTEIPGLLHGSWKTPAWNGGVLSLSEILKQPTEELQADTALAFFTQGIEIIRSTVASSS